MNHGARTRSPALGVAKLATSGRALRVFGSLALLPFLVAVSPGDLPLAPVPGVCPALSSAAARIAGLQTGQAVMNESTVTLRFSSEERQCSQWSNEFHAANCLDAWNFSISLPSEKLVPGVHDLSRAGATFGELFVRTKDDPTDDTGCGHSCAVGMRGTGSVALTSAEATLVIDSVDDACITGTISGLSSPSFGDAPDYNGAFFAVRCER